MSKVCTFDNPATMRRECWQDGKLLRSYSAKLLMPIGFKGWPTFFFGANIGYWKTGQLIGDRAALGEMTSECKHESWFLSQDIRGQAICGKCGIYIIDVNALEGSDD